MSQWVAGQVNLVSARLALIRVLLLTSIALRLGHLA